MDACLLAIGIPLSLNVYSVFLSLKRICSFRGQYEIDLVLGGM